MSLPPYVDSPELVKLLRDSDKTPGKDYVIVDVRDIDFKYGNIPSALNIPAYQLMDNVEAAKKKIMATEPKKVIFHCALSQVRGPKSAAAFQRSLENVSNPPEVVVLRGGFNEWQKQYRNEQDLVENLDKDAWDRGVMF